MKHILLALSYVVLTSRFDDAEATQRIPSYSIRNNVRSNQTMTECVTLCEGTDFCASVKFEKSTGTCEQNRFPSGLLLDSLPSPGWTVIVRNTEPVNMTGAVAWQPSSYTETSLADLGIDGNKDSDFFNGGCFHTRERYSFWAVELTQVSQIGEAVIYYRDDCCTIRTAKLRFLVSMSRSDSDSGNATDVGYYEGPPNGAFDNPLHVMFPPGTTGKVFRIKQELDVFSCLCEIILRS